MDDTATAAERADKELIEKLLRSVKREVKQIMEESVTRKFVHEDSSSITSLCAAVDACLSNGLKRRALGLFKTNSTTALLQKVAKNCEAADLILKKVTELENIDPNKRSASSTDSLTRTNRLSFKIKSQPVTSNSAGNSITSSPPKVVRFLWIRVALFEKQLAIIVDHVVQNSSKYFEKDALVSDPVAGQILASLLVGPCALDYTKMKTQDQFWSDPPADELVQRHRISSSIVGTGTSGSSMAGCGSSMSQSTPPSARKPLGFRKLCISAANNHSDSGESDPNQNGSPISRSSTICWSPRDYVESLHQNSRSQLLFGKNNVFIQPKDDMEPMPGYLSLHQESFGLIIKWTPNQLINGRTSQNSAEIGDSIFNNSFDKSNLFWNYALNVNVENVVYLHCHQQKRSCGSIVMVGRDGVMHPPIKFPKGGHLLAFLSCLESGLMPYNGQLDPPLWSEKGKGIMTTFNNVDNEQNNVKNDQHNSTYSNLGKIFPKLKRKGSKSPSRENVNEAEDNEDVASDYVFRIISICDKPESICLEMMEPKVTAEKTTEQNKNEPSQTEDSNNITAGDSSVSDTNSLNCTINNDGTNNNNNQSGPEANGHDLMNDKQHIQILCDTMKKQIISRAFYGWLAYCRHLKTVRTHLAVLVNQTIVHSDTPTDAAGGITTELWDKIRDKNGRITIDPMEFYRLVYFGGVAHSIRLKVWPYLLEHYKFDDDNEAKMNHDIEMKHKYEMIMSDWLAVEAIVRQRDKEIVAANLAKLSSESNHENSTSEAPFAFDKKMLRSIKSTSNEVFEESMLAEDFSVSDTRKSSAQSDNGTIRNVPSEEKSQNNSKEEEDSKDSNEPKCDQKEELPIHMNGNASANANHNSNDIRKQLIRHKQVESVTSLGGAASANLTGLQNIFITNPSIDQIAANSIDQSSSTSTGQVQLNGDENTARLPVNSTESGGSQCVSPASSNGGIYSNELLDQFSLNLHRIDKDVQRCDRNFWYFNKENLEKLRNIMCTYVWDNLEMGYVQGMCDLVAPLLVIFDDEVFSYSCFCALMKRMAINFPHGGAMDTHFANMRSLIQILDADIFELMHQNGDYTHFYFCYRWFLLDFKRELVYADVFTVWETIWSAKYVSSSSFVLFIALALVEYYRDIILENNMDFTDIIKFFNEMAERHDAKAVLNIARDLVHQIQSLIEDN